MSYGLSNRGVGSNQHQDKPQTRVRDSLLGEKSAGVAAAVSSLAGESEEEGPSPGEIISGLLAADEGLVDAWGSGEAYALKVDAVSVVDQHPEVLEYLWGDADWRVRSRVAGHPNAPDGVWTTVPGDPVVAVRFQAANNPNLPPVVAESLAQDRDAGVREAVAGHPDAPPRVLDWLTGDEDDGVRAAVVQHPCTTGEALTYLAGDVDPVVRGNVARHAGASVSTLRMLTRDPDWRVARTAANRLTTSER